ncbi:MAG: hypothetical protein ACQESR_22670 [Planctomycetota bacterium]
MTKTRIATLIGLLARGLFASAPGEAANRGHRTVTQFVPHLEWSIDNVTYSGNLFDVAATIANGPARAPPTGICRVFSVAVYHRCFTLN